ncbi:hypothetical protein [Photobacterium sp. GB-36]|uniref:hypothetical protein n=1 Tax=Photobacterium sp. GB-36 TaxID=2022108 RepID=UPI000D16200D|nr:hypothetical protein [Photobacterium sp. GB-36]PSV41882.1 hypothetical protein C9J46_15845 [Photobacterium sp. GB-36]
MSIEEVLTYIFTALGSGFVAALIVYYKASFKKSAEIDVISANIEEIIKQQEKLTAATEQVKVDIEHQIWKKQESEQLIRQMIEEYYTCIDKILHYMIDEYHSALIDLVERPENPEIRASLISTLYIPEIQDKHDELIEVINEFYRFMQEVYRNKKFNDGKVPSDEFYEGVKKLDEFADKAKPIIIEIKSILTHKINTLIEIDN